MNVEKSLQKLREDFPGCWFKDGAEFDARHAGSIWTGEGSNVDVMEHDESYEMPAFDHYLYSETMGVHPQLAAVLTAMGLFAEWYDGGTVFIYEV